MFGSNITRGLSFTKIISGLSRGLNFANQMIPIYQQAKPMLNNARKIMATIKEFSHYNPPQNNNNISKKNTVIKTTTNQNVSNPVFFQ